MKRNCFKYIFVFLFSTILALCFLVIIPSNNNKPISFNIQTETNQKDIFPYIDKSGAYYVFLPSYANIENLSLHCNGNTISVDGQILTNDSSLKNFELKTEYRFVVNNTKTTIQFLKSANVATLFIDTVSNSMYQIDNNKKHKEKAQMLLLTPNGDINHLDDFCMINGRGNATWSQKKKPYVITLSSSGDLLNMGNSYKWILLSNNYDVTNLKNKIVFDLANKVGMEGSPKSEYVDLYLNGEYNGLYLLTTKIESGENRLDINTSKNDFLCNIDLNERFPILSSPFKSSLNRTIEIIEPQNINKEKKENIENTVNHMEAMIVSGTFSDGVYNIDIQSWVNRYLIDEISANIDSDLASSYFYFKDGVFYAGPVWDYDNSLGSTARTDPFSFVAKNRYKILDNHSEYYNYLYNNKQFYDYMTRTYKEVFLPVIQEMTDNEIDSLATSISDASHNNIIRWSELFVNSEPGQEAAHTYKNIIDFLKKRTDFLNQAWLNSVEYCTVQVKNSAGVYGRYTVKKGDTFSLISPELQNQKWINGNTGNLFDFSQPITEDIFIYCEQQQQPPQKTTRSLITLASIAAILFLLIVFIIIDVRHRTKKKGS